MVRVLILCGTAFFISALMHFPGHLPHDGVIELDEGRFLYFYSALPPLMGFLLGMMDRVISGWGGWFLVSSAIYWTGIGLIFRKTRLSWLIAAVVFLLFFPPFFSLAGMINKDISAINSLVLAFGHYSVTLESRRPYPWLILASFCHGVAIILRPQLIVTLLATVLMFWWRRRGRGNPPHSTEFRPRILTVLHLAGVFAAVIGVPALIASVAEIEPTAGQGANLKRAMVYEMAGTIRFSEANLPATEKARIIASDDEWRQLAALYIPARADTLFNTGPMDRAPGIKFSDLAPAWFGEITAAPGAYAHHWLASRMLLLGLGNVYDTWPVYSGISKIPAPLVEKLGISTIEPPWSTRILQNRYFPVSPFYRNVIYLSLAIVAFVIAFRSRNVFVLTLVGSGLLYGSTYLGIALSSEFRYLNWLLFSSCLSALLLLADTHGRYAAAAPLGPEAKRPH
jgi:hypothetical protein